MDFAIASFTLTKARSEVIQFLTPIVEEPCSFILQLPVEDKLSLYIRPFHVRTNPAIWYCFIYLLPRANEVWGKVIFLHLSVILFTGGGGGVPGQVASLSRNIPLGRYTPPGQVYPSGQIPHRAVHAGRYGQKAGSTHPTGMHSCLFIFFAIKANQLISLIRRKS